jgi:hypothetical protein
MLKAHQRNRGGGDCGKRQVQLFTLEVEHRQKGGREAQYPEARNLNPLPLHNKTLSSLAANPSII